jgi:hypothetical protein
LEGVDFFYGIGEIDGNDECRSFHLRDAHEKFPTVTTGMKGLRVDAAFSIWFILGFTSNYERQNFLRRKEMLLLAKLRNDFLFGTGIAFVLTKLPVGSSVDSLGRPTEGTKEVWIFA